MRTKTRGARPSIRVCALPRWIGFSEKCQSGSDRWQKRSPKARTHIRRQAVPQLRDQRVEDKAFHLTKHRVEVSPQRPFQPPYGRACGVGRSLGIGVGRGVAVGVTVGVALGVGVGVIGGSLGVGVGLGGGVTVAVAVAVAVAVGVGVASDWRGAWTSTEIGEPVLKNPMFAVVSAGGAVESKRKLYNVPKRIALAFWFCTNVSQFQVADVKLLVKIQGVLLYPASPWVPSCAKPGC